MRLSSFWEALFRALGYVPKQSNKISPESADEASGAGERERDPLPPPDTSTLEEGLDAVGLPHRIGAAFWESTVDLTDKSNVKDSSGSRRRKGVRTADDVNCLVWHQTGFTWRPWEKRKWSSHHKINAHLCIDTNGNILVLHPFFQKLWTANGFNSSCVSIEIMGNFEGEQGTGNWYKPEKFGYGRPTEAQITSARALTCVLANPGMIPDDAPAAFLEWRRCKSGTSAPLTYVYAHRQSGTRGGKPTRPLDPGSEVWQKVGQWAVVHYRLSDGGDGFCLPGALPIPESWKHA